MLNIYVKSVLPFFCYLAASLHIDINTTALFWFFENSHTLVYMDCSLYTYMHFNSYPTATP